MPTFNQIQTRLKTRAVGIAGCGGLGSNCAVALARVGVGKLVIADFDKVEKSNLNRQYYFFDQIEKPKADALKTNIERINPEVKVEAYILKLDETNITDIFSGCDVIVEAFDRADMKQMIIETVLDKMPGLPIVSGVGMAGWGRSDIISVKHYDNLYVCGDGVSEANDQNPPIAPRVGIVSNMQANVVLEILLGPYK